MGWCHFFFSHNHWLTIGIFNARQAPPPHSPHPNLPTTQLKKSIHIMYGWRIMLVSIMCVCVCVTHRRRSLSWVGGELYDHLGSITPCLSVRFRVCVISPVDCLPRWPPAHSSLILDSHTRACTCTHTRERHTQWHKACLKTHTLHPYAHTHTHTPCNNASAVFLITNISMKFDLSSAGILLCCPTFLAQTSLLL